MALLSLYAIAAPFLLLASIYLAVLYFVSNDLRKKNPARRAAVFSLLSPNGEKKSKVIVVGFFHPYCNSGGGGERVLWTAVAYLQRTEPNVVSVVYTGDTDASKEDIIAKVKARFNITLAPESLSFAYLRSRHLVDDKTWPRFTLLGQSIGSMWLGWEALNLVVPDIFIDTMGYAFTFSVIRLLRISSSASFSTGPIPISAYVHYPTISTDMLSRVRNRQAGVTNNSEVASSTWRTSAKLVYYHLFAHIYATSLSQANHIVVNSSWTKNHIDSLLRDFTLSFIPKHIAGKVDILYPPCDCRDLEKFSLEGRERVILSVAQFRPEKNHAAQLRALQGLLEAHPELKSGSQRAKLVLLGSARNEEDMDRVEDLKILIKEMKLEGSVEFVLNAPHKQLLDWLSISSVGISTMVDEHFGINIVEFMAAGLIPVVHASGGPLNDIVVPLQSTAEPTGFHAGTDEEFSECLTKVFDLGIEEEIALRRRAREGAKKFDQSEFEKGWEVSWKKVVALTGR